jgi:multiple sugar transport system substrate-binding protein
MGTNAPLSDISEENLVHFETEVMMIPQFDPAQPAMISQGPSVCIFNKADPQEVLASWLFTQFLLTDSVQLGYSRTEGYVPVTAKAQGTAEYRDYLSRGGEDNGDFYEVKIKAAQLLLDNTAHTFVTPVFNGSASLRDAAGQLIENVTKSMRRHETVDEAYFERLWSDITALYRLDQVGSTAVGQTELGPLPGTAVVLLGCLGAAWVGIGLYVGIDFAKRKNRK